MLSRVSTIAALLGSLCMTAASHAAEPTPPRPDALAIKPGDTVVVVQDKAQFKLGAKVLAELAKGTEFRVTSVEGEWIGGVITLDGKQEKGWVRRNAAMLKGHASSQPTPATNDVQRAEPATTQPVGLSGSSQQPQERKALNSFVTIGTKVYGSVDGKLLVEVILFLDTFPKNAAVPKDRDVDRIVPLVAANGKDVIGKEGLAFAFDKAMPSAVSGLDRGDAVRTAVVPRKDVKLQEKLNGHSVETFLAGEIRTLNDLVAKVGQPAYMENWSTPVTEWFGLSAKTHWWRGVGVACDARGEITHILIRNYPGDDK